MAKKSARSKGYRKTIAKKPYLTTKEIVISVAILVVVILGVVLFNLLYDDGALDVVDGVAVVEGENSIIVNDSSTSTARYFKLGEAGEIEGYTLEATASLYDSNIVEYTYTPEDENSPVERINTYGYAYSAKELSDALQNACASAENTTCTDVRSAQIDGKDVRFFSYNMIVEPEEEVADDASADAEAAEDAAESDETADAADAEETGVHETQYLQSMSAYVDAGNGRSVAYLISVTVDSEAEFLSEDDLYGYVEQCVSSLRMGDEIAKAE